MESMIRHIHNGYRLMKDQGYHISSVVASDEMTFPTVGYFIQKRATQSFNTLVSSESRVIYPCLSRNWSSCDIFPRLMDASCPANWWYPPPTPQKSEVLTSQMIPFRATSTLGFLTPSQDCNQEIVISFWKVWGLGAGWNYGYLLAWYTRNRTASMTTVATINHSVMISKLLIIKVILKVDISEIPYVLSHNLFYV